MTTFTLNGTIFESNEKGNYFYKSTGKMDKKGNPVMMRIPRHIFEQAFEEYLQTEQDNADAWQEQSDAELAERQRMADESDKAAEDAFNKNKPSKKILQKVAAKKASKPRKSKDIAYEMTRLDGETSESIVTLTAKQVDFIRHIPDTNFYEHGLESTPWCDVLADEIGGQFAGKPMTVGAMISTLREKKLIYVQEDRINGKKAKYFGFTELGKQVAKELGLN